MKSLAALLCALALVPALASATPHCQPCPFSCADLGLGKKDCSVISESRGLCCLDLTSKGLALAKEQERLLAQKTVQATACPPGFKPSEQSCSPQERKRGCHDQRVGPERRGCVTASFR